MGRPTIADLVRVYNADAPGHINAEPHLESHSAAMEENAARHSALGVTLADAMSLDNDKKLFRAVLALSRSIGGDSFTQASAVHMRNWRLAAVEQLQRAVEDSAPENCATFTAIPPSWVLTPEELEATTARQLTERFRALLNRNGAGKASGWLLAKLDDEFDVRNQLHRFHLHGVACGEMIDVLDSLRDSNLLKPKRTAMIDGCRVVRPLHIDRRPLTDLPRALSYLLKGHFSARWLGYGSDGTVRRGRHPCRIPEPFGTRTLVWLDQQNLADMFITFGLTVRDGQLVTRR